MRGLALPITAKTRLGAALDLAGLERGLGAI
jgi:hypothetical protein